VDRLTFDDDAALALADDAATIHRIVRAYPAERLRDVKFGDWTALEVIGHIADLGEVFAERVRRCVREDRPTVAAVDQDELAHERRNNDRDPMDLARRIDAAHRELVQTLMNAASRSRPGVHPEYGEVDAGHFGAYHARHSHEHTAALAAAFPPRG
jgi:hypothetical protein